MSWVAVAGAAVGVVGSYLSSQNSADAASNAAQAQENAANQANATQLQIYNQTRQDLQPYNQTGQAALNQLGALYGIGPNGTSSGAAPNYSAFMNSPDYQFALQQGTQNLDASAAAKGRLYSGGYGQDLTKFAQGLATQNLQNYENRLQGIAGMGQNAAAMQGSFGAQYGMQNSMNLMNGANAAANGIMGNAAAQNGMYNALGYYGQGLLNQFGNQPNYQTYQAPIQVNPGQAQGTFTGPSDISMPMQGVSYYG